MRHWYAAVALALLLAASTPAASDAPPPTEFASIPLGTTLTQLRERYPEARRNPDSDHEFIVYQVPALHGVPVDSPAAFSFYKDRLVGGQILLNNTSIASYWLQQIESHYGAPASCTYCDYPDMANAHWHWPGGTTVVIDGGMLSEFTAEGSQQRLAWIARGESETVASAETDLAPDDLPRTRVKSVARKPAPASAGQAHAASKPPPPPSRWDKLYAMGKQRVMRWLEWK